MNNRLFSLCTLLTISMICGTRANLRALFARDPASTNISAAPEKGDDEAANAALTILSQNCYRCHGPNKQEGGLRLDNRDAALRGGDSGRVIEAGQASKSLLLDYVSGKGNTVMPPEGKRLSADEVAVLTHWIAGGIRWPETAELRGLPAHWSFRPVERPALPKVDHANSCRGAIDRFVMARLEKEHVALSPEANRNTLLRRLSFDLVGLPPTIDEVRSFLADTRTDAYERLVDRLLASPHFGERWGRYWLDRARYADTSGCVIDLPRLYAWQWRDWVIDAFNRDMPFDQFTIEQVAGDLLPNATIPQRIAAGFHRLAPTNHEAGVDQEAERVKTTVDRTSTVATAFLGLTAGCAECHSHKYDPIPQRDFYRLYAFFDSLEDREIDAPRIEAMDQLPRAAAALEAARKSYTAEPAKGQVRWERSLAAIKGNWTLPGELEPVSIETKSHAVLHKEQDGSYLVVGRPSTRDSYMLAFASPLQKVTAIRVEVLPDPERFNRGPGRADDQRCILTGIVVEAGSAQANQPLRVLPVSAAQADYCQAGFNVADALSAGDKETGWAVDQPGLPHAAVFVLKDPLEFKSPGRIVIRLLQRAGGSHVMLRFRIGLSGEKSALCLKRCLPEEIHRLASLPNEQRNPHEQALLKRYYESVYDSKSPQLAAWNAAMAVYAKQVGATAAHTVHERFPARETAVHLRGDFRHPGERVEPGILTALTVTTSADETRADKRRLTRLDLARWLVDGKNPLTARVAVNDIWQHLFGVGLVRTPGDFGAQGEPPTHPELLDYLADRFVANGWSRKAMIREIVASAPMTHKAEETIFVEDSVEVAFGKILRANGISNGPFSKETEEQVLALCRGDLDDPKLVDRTADPFITIDNDDSMDLDQAMFIYNKGKSIVVSYALADGKMVVLGGKLISM